MLRRKRQLMLICMLFFLLVAIPWLYLVMYLGVNMEYVSNSSMNDILNPYGTFNALWSLYESTTVSEQDGMIPQMTMHTDSVKIFIYDFEHDMYTDNMITSCFNHMGPSCADIYWYLSSERVVHRRLLNALGGPGGPLIRTMNGDEADFFYVPFYSSAFLTSQLALGLSKKYAYTETLALVEEVMNTVKTQWPFWKKRNGRDHIWSFTYNHGLCLAPVGDSDRFSPPAGVLNSIFLTTYGHYDDPACFRPSHDIVVPIPLRRSVLEDISIARHEHLGFKRHGVLVLYAGSSSKLKRPAERISERNKPQGESKILRTLLHLYSSDVRFSFISAGMGDKSEVAKELVRAKFCIVLSCSSDPKVRLRVEEAVVAGCIPVILADNVVLPFSDILEWHLFSVRVPEHNVAFLGALLDAIDSQTLYKLETNIIVARKFLTWSEVPVVGMTENADSDGVFGALLYSLFKRKNNVTMAMAGLPDLSSLGVSNNDDTFVFQERSKISSMSIFRYKNIRKNILTIVSVPRPLRDDGHVQLVAWKSWVELRPKPIVVLLVSEDSDEFTTICLELGFKCLFGVKKSSASGLPLVSSILEMGYAIAETPLVGFVNSDLVLSKDWILALDRVAHHFSRFLVVGRRMEFNLKPDNAADLTFESLSFLLDETILKNKKYGGDKIDYLVTSSHLFTDVPQFIWSRGYYEKWFVTTALAMPDVAVVDVSSVTNVVRLFTEKESTPLKKKKTSNGNYDDILRTEVMSNAKLANLKRNQGHIEIANWQLVTCQAEDRCKHNLCLLARLSKPKVSTLPQRGVTRDRHDDIIDRWSAPVCKERYDERLTLLHGKYAGKKGIFLGAGPSLRTTPWGNLANFVLVGSNKISLATRYFPVNIHIYVAMDTYIISQSRDDITNFAAKIPTIVPFHVLGTFVGAGEGPGSLELPANIIFVKSIKDSTSFSRDVTEGISQGGSVAFAALQVMSWTGLSSVALLGVDDHYDSSIMAAKPGSTIVMQDYVDMNHFDGKYFSVGQQWLAPNLTLVETAMTTARKVFEEQKRHLYDATPNGHLKALQKISFGELFEQRHVVEWSDNMGTEDVLHELHDKYMGETCLLVGDAGDIGASELSAYVSKFNVILGVNGLVTIPEISSILTHYITTNVNFLAHHSKLLLAMPTSVVKVVGYGCATNLTHSESSSECKDTKDVSRVVESFKNEGLDRQNYVLFVHSSVGDKKSCDFSGDNAIPFCVDITKGFFHGNFVYYAAFQYLYHLGCTKVISMAMSRSKLEQPRIRLKHSAYMQRVSDFYTKNGRSILDLTNARPYSSFPHGDISALEILSKKDHGVIKNI